MRPSVCGVCVCVALILSFIYPSAFMCLVSPCILFFFCKDISLMLSYHTHLLPLPFVSFSISLLLAWFFFIYLPVSLSLLKKNKNPLLFPGPTFLPWLSSVLLHVPSPSSSPLRFPESYTRHCHSSVCCSVWEDIQHHTHSWRGDG